MSQSLQTRQLTFLFTDIEGSTRLWEREPEAMKAALAAHDEIVRHAIQARGGRVFKTMGDAFYAVFTSARDAALAAIDAQRGLSAHPWAATGMLRARMALHTGAAEERGGDFFGPTLNRVARILAVGHGGQILASQAAHALIQDGLPAGVGLRDLGAHRLRDLHRPEHIFQVLVPDLQTEYPPLLSLDALPNNLPRQLTSFVGREREMDEIKRLLRQGTLLTIVGAGGAGKTRLALQVAADVLEEFADGVWLVELAPLADPDLVPSAAAAALSLREEPNRPILETLEDYFRPREALLIFDNCEHLVDACAMLIDELLRTCPRLRVLCTSREALGVTGEVAWRIPSLSLPDPRHLPPIEQLSAYEAIRLFVERAGAVAPGFALTPEHAPAVAAISRRLDGIPLAIELAAARAKVLTVEQIASRLDDRFRLLTGGSRTALPRHQTLRAAMDWSYDLLTDPERATLRRLSTFAGGWTLEAAEAVCAGGGVDPADVLDHQTALVDKSLVVMEEIGGAARYRLLETVRQYGRDRLFESGEAEPTRVRHRDWFLALAERAEPNLQGPEQTEWFDRLEVERDNLSAALEWSLGSGEPDSALRLAVALWWFWFVRGHLKEGSRWLGEAVARTSAPTPLRARGLAAAGVLAYAEGNYAAATRLCEEGLAVAREVDDKLPAGISLAALSLIAMWRGERERAAALAEETRALMETLHYAWGEALATLVLAEIVRSRGRWAESLTMYEKSLALFRLVGDRWGMALAQRGMGFIARAEGDYARASALHEEGLAAARGLGDRTGTAYLLLNLALDEMRRGLYASAAERIREGIAMARETGDRGALTNLLYYLGLVTAYQGRNDEAERYLAEALEIARAQEARLVEAYALSGLARVDLHRGENSRAARLATDALEKFKAAGDRWGVGVSLYIIGAAAAQQHDYPEAMARGEESLRQFEELGDRWAAGSSQRLLGRAALGLGRYAQAEEMYAASLASARQRGELMGVTRSLAGLAHVAARSDRPERAAVLLGAEAGLREIIASPVPHAEHAAHQRTIEGIRAALGETAFAAAWARGLTMPWERAAEYALADQDHAAAPGA